MDGADERGVERPLRLRLTGARQGAHDTDGRAARSARPLYTPHASSHPRPRIATTKGAATDDRAAVALAQPAEHRIVAPKVMGSSPIGHPNLSSLPSRTHCRCALSPMAQRRPTRPIPTRVESSDRAPPPTPEGRRRSVMLTRKVLPLLAALTLGATLLSFIPAAVVAAPSEAACDNRTNDSVSKLLECVTVEGVLEHEQALQDIADDNDGNRSSGSDRLRGLDRLRRGSPHRCRVQRHPPGVRLLQVRRSRRVRPGADRAGLRDLCGGHRLLRHAALRERRGGHSRGDAGRRPAGTRQHVEQRLRDNRLRRIPDREHRADPARDLHLRAQG